MKKLKIKPTEMSGSLMNSLQDKGLLIRIAPHIHDTDPQIGETLDKNIYVSHENSGPHKLISVTVNRTNFAKFGYHPDNEEFWLIGSEKTKPMFLAICYLSIDEFDQKIANDTISEDDFIMLRCRYNDPEVSFFVMNANVLHGEGIVESDLACPSFYVTEGRDNPTILPDWHGYELAVDLGDRLV